MQRTIRKKKPTLFFPVLTEREYAQLVLAAYARDVVRGEGNGRGPRAVILKSGFRHGTQLGDLKVLKLEVHGE